MPNETLTLEQAQNLHNYLHSVTTELENILDVPVDDPINEEYCWMHSGPGLGGWCCQHEECRVAGKE